MHLRATCTERGACIGVPEVRTIDSAATPANRTTKYPGAWQVNAALAALSKTISGFRMLNRPPVFVNVCSTAVFTPDALSPFVQKF